jgi:hypothetical protein
MAHQSVKLASASNSYLVYLALSQQSVAPQLPHVAPQVSLKCHGNAESYLWLDLDFPNCVNDGTLWEIKPSICSLNRR